MFSQEFKDFLVQILTSWQVIVVAIVVILYIILVSYIASFHQNDRPKRKAKQPGEKKVKKEKPKKHEVDEGEFEEVEA